MKHWRHHRFSGVRPFFFPVEAVDTTIWLTEVAPEEADIDVPRCFIVVCNNTATSKLVYRYINGFPPRVRNCY